MPYTNMVLLEAMEFFEFELNRLQNDIDLDRTTTNNNIPDSEWGTIMAYHKAITTAISMVIPAIQDIAPCLKGDNSSDNTSVCKISPKRYDSLRTPTIDTAEVTRPYSCDTEVSMDFSDYDSIETIKSIYQTINFFQHADTKDMCFDLDDTYQQCTSYRPQYHEMVVHYTARFLPNIQRVLFVGGGDSMLLHEVLQYPNLEFVIGLELDQKVTRSSFKHFGTQPHWDNPKVQRWFGDGAKSGLMLPQEYFGTFIIWFWWTFPKQVCYTSNSVDPSGENDNSNNGIDLAI